MPKHQRIVVADDHPIFLEGIKLTLAERGLNVVGEAKNGREALDLVAEHDATLAILDVRMPVLDGLQTLAAIKRDHPHVCVILLTGHVDTGLAYEAIEAGAGAYLLKSYGVDEVIEAIGVVIRGGTVMPPEVQRELAQSIRARQNGHDILTPREQEVLKLMAEGMSAGHISDRLNIARTTVKSHQRSLYHKLEVKNSAACVREGFRRHLIE